MHKQHQCNDGDATARCDPDTEGRHVTSTVSISNLPGAFDSTSLRTLFTEVGPVLDCFMINGEGSDMTGRGFVQFTTTQDAEKAIQQKNGFPLSGKNIVVEVANVQAVIFWWVQNSGVAREDIRQAREIGSVLSVNYPLSEDKMELYGLTQDGCESYAASVLFADVKSAKSDVSCLHHKEVEGVTIWARPLGAENVTGSRAKGVSHWLTILCGKIPN